MQPWRRINPILIFLLTLTVVSGSSHLRLDLPKKRPAHVVIESPEDRWYLVHSEEDNIYLTPHQHFMAADYIAMAISCIKGVRWVDGERKTFLVFDQPGQYKVHLTDDVETKLENTFHLTRTLTYQGSKL